MTKSQSKQAKSRFERESTGLCAECHGTGRVLTQSAIAKAKRGGNASCLKSLIPGNLFMSDRGKLGGRPKDLSLEDDSRRICEKQDGASVQP